MARIMLADDALIIKSMLREILTSAGHHITAEASNGEEVLEAFTATRPDLLILDITMPVKDGLETLKILLEKYPYAKVIMCSAMCQDDILSQCLKLGAKGFIMKPFNPQKVLEAIDSTLGQ